jgi:hypothetical protein
MEKTVNIDFNNSSSLTLGYSADVLYSGMPHWAESTHIHGSILLYNLSATSASSGLTLSANPPSAAANAVYGGSYISLSTSGVSTTVHVSGLQPAGAYLTTAALSDHSHGVAAATGLISGTISSGTKWSLSIPNFVQASELSTYVHAGAIGTNTSTYSIAGSNQNLTLNSWGLRMGIPNWLTTAARLTHHHGIASGTNITIGSSSNGLALSVRNALGTNTSLATQSGSVASMIGNTSGLTLSLPSFVAGGNNLTLGGNTSGTLTLMSSGVVTIAGGNNITLNQNGNAFTINGADGIAIAASNTTYTNGTIMFSADANLTIGTTITNGIQYIKLSANIAGSTAGDGGNILAAGTQTANSVGSVIFSNSNGISFGMTSNSVITANYTQSTHDHPYINTSASDSFQLTSDNSLSLGTIYTTHTHNYQSVGAYLTTAAQSIHYHSNYLTTAALSDHSHSEYLTTAALSNHTHSQYINTSASSLFQHTSATSTITSNAINTSRESLYQLIANSSNSLGTTYTSHTHSQYVNSTEVGNVYFVNSNSITFGSSVSNNNTSITASFGGTFSGTAAGAITFSAGTQSRSLDSVIFSNSNGISFGLNNSTITASYTVPAMGTLSLMNSNGISFGTSVVGNTTTVTGSVNTAYIPLSHSTAYNTSVLSTAFIPISSSTAFGGNGIKAIGITNDIDAFTSGSVMISAQNLTVNTSVNGASQYLQISAPQIGYLFFSNNTNLSWSSSTSGVSTSIWMYTA